VSKLLVIVSTKSGLPKGRAEAKGKKGGMNRAERKRRFPLAADFVEGLDDTEPGYQRVGKRAE